MRENVLDRDEIKMSHIKTVVFTHPAYFSYLSQSLFLLLSPSPEFDVA